jgi:hypothetical protein
VISVEIRHLDPHRILIQVGDQWHLVLTPDAAAQLGAMLLDAAYPDHPSAVLDTYSMDITAPSEN